MHQRFVRTAGIGLLVALAWSVASAQDASPEALQQMQSIAAVKAGFTPGQKKMSSDLAFGILAASNDSRVSSFRNAIDPLRTTDIAAVPQAASSGAGNSVVVEIFGSVTPELTGAITSANGVVLAESARWGVVTASLPIAAVAFIADRADVRKIRTPARPHTNVGSVTSQGYVSHEANKVVTNLNISGAGVTVGVLSDSALPARVAALIASGDLGPDTQVLPGQQGPSDGSDEGTAMMEIVHDLAPRAKIIFATAFNSEQSFADNIIALKDAGAKVIVDDVSYFDEPAFQDGIVAQAVNQVTAAGVIYFSSAANSGSLTKGTSGTWEGDFLDGGPVAGPVLAVEGGGNVHNFRTAASPQNYDVLNGGTQFIGLHWSDPLAASANDYDVFVLNSTGTAVLGFSADSQTGTQDPFELAYREAGFPVGSRVVVVKYAGATRALHVDTERGVLSIATSGATFGHNAGLNTVSMAATYWNSARTGTRPFTGPANTNETFSSDGPRKIFYTAAGAPITPGNLLFGTNGGLTLQKPDLAAADGVTTRTPGFNPFFGTSAAAPHAAAIAALVRAARPDYTVAQVKAAMTATALDSMAAGVDRDSGFGIAMALAAVQYALTH